MAHRPRRLRRLTPNPLQALLDAIAALQRPTDAVRVFHGRGGRFPGCEAWTLDAYPPVWVLTCHATASDEQAAQLLHALQARWAEVAPGEPLNCLLQQRQDARASHRVLAGAVAEEHGVTEDGAHYAVHLPRGLNHGFFLDMAEGRRWVRRWAQARPGGRVLNLFAYTCAFSVAALQGGARRVLNIDMAAGALGIGKRNHALNSLASGASFLPHDVFSSWGRLRREAPYDLVIVDPPSYQKGSFVATRDYAKLTRRLPDLVAPGGHVLLCLNAPELPTAFLHERMRDDAPLLQFVERLPAPPGFADAEPERALKALVFRQPG